MISASEVNRYVYCARAWWLQRVVGHEPTNVKALDRGSRSHRDHSRLVVGARRYADLARWLVVAALAIAVALIHSFLQR